MTKYEKLCQQFQDVEDMSFYGLLDKEAAEQMLSTLTAQINNLEDNEIPDPPDVRELLERFQEELDYNKATIDYDYALAADGSCTLTFKPKTRRAL